MNGEETCLFRCRTSGLGRWTCPSGASRHLPMNGEETFLFRCRSFLPRLRHMGGIAIAEACGADERDVALKTRAGMEELGRRFPEAKPEVGIVATPHTVHIANALGVVAASRLKGRSIGVALPIELDLPSDTGLA